jgi:amidase
VDAECLAACHGTAAALAELGHHVEEVPAGVAPRTSELLEPVLVLLATRISLAVDAVVSPTARGQLMPYTRWLCAQAGEHSARDLAVAQSRLAALAGSWLRLQERYDVILTPATSAPPLPTGALRKDDARDSAEAMLRWTAFTPWANLTGTPAVALPVHVTPAGLPVGVQLHSGAGHDEQLISLAASLEEVFRWQERHPPQW